MLTYQDLTMDHWITLLKKLKLLGFRPFKKTVHFITDQIELSLNEVYEALEPGLDVFPGLDKAVDLATEDGYKWYNLSNEEKLHYLAEMDIQDWILHDCLIYQYKWFYLDKFINPAFIEKLVQYLNTDLDRQEYINEKIKDLFGEE